MTMRWIMAWTLLFGTLLLGACGPVGDNGDDSSSRVTNCSTYQDLSNISEDTTLERGTCYETDRLRVDGAVLTIEPGVVIRFQENGILKLTNSPELHVNGSADNKVLFTATEKERGWWKGIVKAGTSSNARLEIEHAIVEYGGANNSQGNIFIGRCCNNNATVQVTHTTLRESEAFGFRSKGGLDLEKFADNTITSNKKGALKLKVNDITAVEGSNQLAGNDQDFVRLTGNISEELTFSNLDVPYLVSKNLIVHDSGGGATIEAGAEFVFEQDAGIRVGEADSQGGYLKAKGTADNEIVFRGKEDIGGYWDGISFAGTQSLENRLEHVVVSGGGGVDSKGNVSLHACCGNTVTATLTNVTFEKCGEGGAVYLGKDSKRIRDCSNLTLGDGCSLAVDTNGDQTYNFSTFQSNVCE